MGDDLERLSRLLDDLCMERDPRDRTSLSADEVELAETAAFLKSANGERGEPDPAFVERLGAQLAAARSAEGQKPDVETRRGISRRGLLGRLATAAAGLAVGAGAAEVVRGQTDEAAAADAKAKAYSRGKQDGAHAATVGTYDTPMVPHDRGEWLETSLKNSDIAPGRAVRFRAGAVEGFLVNPGEGRPIYALSAACTHMGCMITWLDGASTFLCPCHGAQYNADGTVLDGIARHPLPPLKLKVDDDGSVYVWAVSEHPTVKRLEPYKRF